MQFHTPLEVSPRGEPRAGSEGHATGGPQDSAGEELSDEELFAAAQQMEGAISALLHNPDPAQRQEANQWLTASCGQPIFWTIALYLAFPPPHRPMRSGPDVRFFALNILLNKIRSDSDQLSYEAATEIYEALLRQLPTVSDPLVRSRLCIVTGAAAALSGPHICYELVEAMEREAEYPVAVDLLTALAEEALMRSRALPREVLECLQECCPKVLRLLERGLADPQLQGMDAALLARSLVCLARWKNAGLTLSELHREHPTLHRVLLMSLGSRQAAVQEAAAGVLTELVSEVDILPGRDEAVRATIQGVLAQRGVPQEDPSALVDLVAAIGAAEAGLVAQGQEQELALLQWLLQLTAGDTGPPAPAPGASAAGGKGAGEGEARDLGAASLACEAWPKISRVPKARRGAALQDGALFTSAMQAVLRASVPPSDDEIDIDQDDFRRFREGPASEALQACYKELGASFLDAVSAHMQAATSWEGLEVGVFAAGAVSPGVLQAAGLLGAGPLGQGQGQGGQDAEREKEKEAALQFLARLFWSLPGAAALGTPGDPQVPHPSLVSTVLHTAALYAPFCVHNPSALEVGVVYAVGALRLKEARGEAAATLQALCVAAGPSLAAARALAPLMQRCEEAAASAAGEGGLEEADRAAIVRGLASVAAMLPLEEAQAALAHLAGPAMATIQQAASPQAADARRQLSADLKVVTCLVEAVSDRLTASANAASPSPLLPAPPVAPGGAPEASPGTGAPGASPQSQGGPEAGGGGNKAELLLLPLLQGVWPAVEALAGAWADDAGVGAALCSLWGATARAVGSQLAAVLPQVIVSATRMFESHRHAACLLCLADILGMPRVGARASPQVEEALAAVPPVVLAALPALHQALLWCSPSSPSPHRTHALSRSPGHPGGVTQQGGAQGQLEASAGAEGGGAVSKEAARERYQQAAEALAAVWQLLLSYVAHSPRLLLSSPAFPGLCEAAAGCLGSREPEVARTAALFLADTIVGQPLEALQGGRVPLALPAPPPPAHGQPQPAPLPRWHLSEEELAVVQQACAPLGGPVVEELLMSLAAGGAGAEVASAQVDLLYALCVRHPAACEAAMGALLRGARSPLKSVEPRHLHGFLAAATRQPPHSRQRFHDLLSDYSKVASRLMPAEVFEGY